MNLRAALAQGIWAEEIAVRLYRSAECEGSLFTRQDVYDYCMSLPDVDPEMLDEIPPLSLLREFIGGCTLEKA